MDNELTDRLVFGPLEGEGLRAGDCNPLPGRTPYDNYRPLSVPKTCDGMTRLDTLVTILPIVVLEKPGPLPMHPGGRFNGNTLQYILDEVYHPQKLRACHRWDANTTGTPEQKGECVLGLLSQASPQKQQHPAGVTGRAELVFLCPGQRKEWITDSIPSWS